MPRNAYVRIGSTTKTFMATVLLQLVGEGRLSLDDTVDRRLPGVVRGQGAGWKYSNTNYLLVNMVIKAVTGRSWAQEVQARIVRPLRLTRTLTPGNWPFLPGPHARGYQ
ncbi:hypothetical protein GCM10009577_46880 [Streptomyces javensis]